MTTADVDRNQNKGSRQNGEATTLEPQAGCLSSKANMNIFEYEIDKIKQEILDLVDKSALLFKTNFDNKDNILPFIYLEEQLMEINTLIVKQVLTATGISMSFAKESILLKIYKEFFKKSNVILRTNKKITSNILTTSGIIPVTRYVLRGKTNKDLSLLKSIGEEQSICPVDDYIGISNYGFKMSPAAMLEIADKGCREESFKAAAIVLKKIFKEEISYETIRNVTHAVGKFVFENDNYIAKNTIENVHNSR